MCDLQISKNEIDEAKNFMRAKNLHFSDYWLISCLKWLKEQFQNTTDSNQIHENVYQQWLLSDLRELKINSLPPSLKDKKKFVLNGYYAVQILYVLDVSKSVFSQLQTIRNKHSLTLNYQTDEEKQLTDLYEKNTNRYLKIVLTDGVQEITAFEYKKLPQLQLNVKPGSKALLKGPISIKKGVLFLEERNLKILGGHVENLLIPNHYENVLAKILKLSINENVLKDHANENSSDNDRRRNNSNSNHDHDDNKETLTNIKSEPTLKNELTNSFLDGLLNDDFNLNNFEIDNDDEFNKVLESIDKKMEEKKSLQNVSVISLSDDDDEDNISLKKLTPKAEAVSMVNTYWPNQSMIDENDDDIFAEIDIDQHLDLIEEQINNQAVKRKKSEDEDEDIVNVQQISVQCSSLPYNYIKQILERSRDHLLGKTIRIYARFKSVVKSITVIKKAWSMSFLITDFTGDLIVQIDGKVIEQLIGYGPEEVNNLKKRTTESSAVKELLIKAFQKCERKMLEKSYLMELNFVRNSDVPILMNLNDFNEDDGQILDKRIKFALNQL